MATHKFIPAGKSLSGKLPCRTCGKEAGHPNHKPRSK